MEALYTINVVVMALAGLIALAFVAGAAIGGYLLVTGDYTEEDDHVPTA